EGAGGCLCKQRSYLHFPNTCVSPRFCKTDVKRETASKLNELERASIEYAQLKRDLLFTIASRFSASNKRRLYVSALVMSEERSFCAIRQQQFVKDTCAHRSRGRQRSLSTHSEQTSAPGSVRR